jgi:hypothetical protein
VCRSATQGRQQGKKLSSGLNRACSGVGQAELNDDARCSRAAVKQRL